MRSLAARSFAGHPGCAGLRTRFAVVGVCALGRETDRILGRYGYLGLADAGASALHQPAVQALLMEQELFEQHSSVSAVVEPIKALESAPPGLLADEADFYRYLLVQERGRHEQEYLPKVQVECAIEQCARKIPV